MVKENRLNFIKRDNNYYGIWNKKEEFLGSIEKMRVGSYMHWCYCPTEEIFISAGCLDEIRQFMKNPEKYIEKNEEINSKN